MHTTAVFTAARCQSWRKWLLIFVLIFVIQTFCFAGRYDVSYYVNGCKVDIVGPLGTHWSQDYSALPSFAGGSGFSGEPTGPGGAPALGSGSVHCHGTITAVFNWNNLGDPYDIPPPIAIVREDALASWTGTSGSASDGLNHSPQNNTYGGVCGGTLYWIKVNPQTSFSIECAPDATASVSGPPMPNAPTNAYASVNYQAAATPIRLALYGTTWSIEDSSRLDFAEIGQAISAYPDVDDEAVAEQVSFQSFTWDIQGDTFKSFNVSQDLETGWVTYLTAVDYHHDLPQWCWRTPSGQTYLVSCNVDIKIDGGDLGYADLSRHATVVAPTSDMDAETGPVSYTASGVRGGDDNSNGVVFDAQVKTDQRISNASTDGRWMYVQLCKLNRVNLLASTAHQTIQFDDFRLDTSWGYERPVSNPFWADNFWNDTRDSPTWALLGAISYNVSDTYDMYLMYLPPGTGSQWVSIKKLEWTWTTWGSRAAIGLSWPEPVNGSVTAGSAEECYVHPTWQACFQSGGAVPIGPRPVPQRLKKNLLQSKNLISQGVQR